MRKTNVVIAISISNNNTTIKVEIKNIVIDDNFFSSPFLKIDLTLTVNNSLVCFERKRDKSRATKHKVTIPISVSATSLENIK